MRCSLILRPSCCTFTHHSGTDTTCTPNGIGIIIMKGSEPEWANPKLNTGNCLKCPKIYLKTYLPYEHYYVHKLEWLVSSETHFALTPMFGGWKSHFCGLTWPTLVLSPSHVPRLYGPTHTCRRLKYKIYLWHYNSAPCTRYETNNWPHFALESVQWRCSYVFLSLHYYHGCSISRG